MITEFVSIMTAIIGAFWDVIVNGMTTLVGVFYDVTEKAFTLWGMLGIVSLGLSLVFFIISWVRSLGK